MTKAKLQAFWKDTSGAVTVDWIVLTAAVVALAVVSIAAIQSGTNGLADNTGAYIGTYDFF